jgi:transposase InsO family protein
VPKVELSDNGTQFTSVHYTEWCKMLGIKPFFLGEVKLPRDSAKVSP